MLKATDITKIYSGVEGQNTVLDDLCFHGRKGQLCIVTGPSGCGKSTLLNVLSSLDSATSGTLEINGRVVQQNHRQLCRVRRNDIGFIFQGYNLISSLTAAENVELSLKYRRVARARRKALALDALEKVGLGLDAVVQMDCLFKHIEDLHLLPDAIRARFGGKYPARKAFTSTFIREGILFQVDAVAYKGAAR